jgi:ribonuclease BN (tRNA processing enzyme)
MFERAFELREYEAGVPFAAAGFFVEPRPVRHYDLDAYGFRVSHAANGGVLAYSGDSAPGPELDGLARGASLFLCEATLSEEAGEPEPRGHLAASEAVAAADGPVLLTHRPFELPAPDGTAVARDGLVVEVGAD